jgi:hypothetical protein
VTNVRTGGVTTEVPARLDRLPWVKTNPRYYCGVLFSALAGTPRRREDP